jgi:cytochrome c553
MKYTLIAIAFIILVVVAGCNKKDEAKAEPRKEAAAAKSIKPEKKEFKMYEMSQMAALMEQMYVDNQRLKERIISGDTIGTFPKHILNIHTSVMTDEDDNDAFFKEQAAKFIKAQQLIYSDPANAKQHYNDAVSSCVQCHEGKCEGPIPRIKKLYIK